MTSEPIVYLFLRAMDSRATRLLACAGALMMTGCGSSEEPTPTPSVAAKPYSGPSAEDADLTGPAPAAKGNAPAVRSAEDADLGPTSAAVQATGGATTGKPATPALPANVTAWTAENFRAARKARNPKLIQAVRELGRGNAAHPDAAGNAQLLGELLNSGESNSGAAAFGGGSAEDSDLATAAGPRAQIPGLAQAIIESLGVNNSPEARNVLKQILLAKQPGDTDDRTLTVAALRTLASNPDAENQKILAAVLTVPESVRPAGRGQLTADQLQEECLRVARPIQLAEFRLQIAQRANRGIASPTIRQRVLTLLLAPEPINAAAQVELSVGTQLDATLRARIDQQLLESGQQVLDRMLAATPADWTAPPTAPISTTPVSADDIPRTATAQSTLPFAEVVKLAEQLWRPDFCQAIAERIETSDNLQAEPTLVALASCLPSDKVRAALLCRWELRWIDEAQNARAVAQFGNGARDPGLLLALKQLPREQPRSAAADAAAAAAAKAKARAPEIRETPQSLRLAKEQTARQDWLKLSDDFVDGLIDHFSKTAGAQARGPNVATAAKAVNSIDDFNSLIDSQTSAKAETASVSGGELLPAAWQLTLHPGAEVRTAYRLDWPTSLHGTLRNSGNGLVIRALRLSSLGDVNALTAFYDRQLKNALLRTVENGRWIDGLVKLDDGRLRTVDVRITRVDSANPPQRGAQERLIVDVLCIEAADPKQQAANSPVK